MCVRAESESSARSEKAVPLVFSAAHGENGRCSPGFRRLSPTRHVPTEPTYFSVAMTWPNSTTSCSASLLADCCDFNDLAFTQVLLVCSYSRCVLKSYLGGATDGQRSTCTPFPQYWRWNTRIMRGLLLHRVSASMIWGIHESRLRNACAFRVIAATCAATRCMFLIDGS